MPVKESIRLYLCKLFGVLAIGAGYETGAGENIIDKRMICVQLFVKFSHQY